MIGKIWRKLTGTTKKKVKITDGKSEYSVTIDHLELAENRRHILVFYIDVGNMAPADVPFYMEKAKKQLSEPRLDDVIFYYIAVRGNQSGSKICHIDLKDEC